MMFLNSSGIISILNWLDFERLANFLSRKSLQTFFSRVGSQLVTSLIILFCWVHIFCTHLPLYWWKSNKIYKQIPKQANNKDIEMAGNSELLTPHPWCNMGRKRKCLGNAEVYVCLDEHLLRQIDGKFWSQIKRYYLPWWLFRSVIIPWFITWSYLFNLESFLAQGSYQISKKEVKSL